MPATSSNPRSARPQGARSPSSSAISATSTATSPARRPQRADAEATHAAPAGRGRRTRRATRARDDVRAENEERLQQAEAALAEAEAALGALQAQTSDLNARRAALERAVREEMERAARFRAEKERVERDIAGARRRRRRDGAAHRRPARGHGDGRGRRSHGAEEAVLEARDALAAARDAESRLRQPVNEAERKAQRLETEARTLAKLVASATGDLWPPALDQITVEKGYETALGAALGDDLDASTESLRPGPLGLSGSGDGDPALPEGARRSPTSPAPRPRCSRRLRQIGVVERGRRRCACASLLKPGQRLVSREGDLWRWDGFTTAAEAPSPAARRLAREEPPRRS